MQGRGDERAGRPGFAQGAQVGEVTDATTGQQLQLGKAGAEVAYQRDVRTRAGPDAREVEHDHLPYSGLPEPCERLGRSEPRQPGVGREQAAVPKVEAEYERGVRKRGPQPLELGLARKCLGADHDARRAQLEQQPDRGDLGDARIHHHPRLARQRGDDLAVGRSARDRVEIGDVELVESERLADGTSDLDGVGAADDPAAQRAIAFALPAHGVHGGSALEIDDWDHSHGRGGSRMGGVIGLDVGGANTKAVWRNGAERRAVSRPFEVWRDREALAAVLREVVARVAREPVEAVALTTTAELSDAFRTKREGVSFVLDAAEAALDGPPLLVFTTAGELVPLDEARARAAEVAAANWVASALAVAAIYPDALMIDVGSTTADVVPIAAGRVAAVGRTDLDRLLAGELVYTGVLRTNLAAIAPRVPVARRLVPGRLGAVLDQRRRAADPRPPGARRVHVPHPGRAPGDGRVRARARGAARMRRRRAAGRGGDRCDRRVPACRAGAPDRGGGPPGERAPRGDPPVVPLGAGAFLAREAAEHLGRAVVELPWSAAERDAAPAAALAELLAGRLRPQC